MCIEAPESTANYLSFGLVEDGAGRPSLRKREKRRFALFHEPEKTFGRSLHRCGRIALVLKSLFLKATLKFRSVRAV